MQLMGSPNTTDNEREGQVRCLNCLSRFKPPHGAEKALCPGCGMVWRISWINQKTPKIRGPEYPAKA
ncbi:MAG: hypothetical protein A3K22_04950 [Deltaproteobacteria bacterium RBG_16_42_7]|nr:MAG: hypothetical protein A3K22_04950 [Deltaproteobacteria bacterium RBG_16_42_7]